MDCKNALQEISSLLDGDLDPELRRSLEEHLKGCHHCKAVVDTTRKTIELYCDGKLFLLPDPVRTRLHDALRHKWAEKSR